MAIPIDSLDIIQQLKRRDIIFQVDKEEMEKFRIDEINERQIVALREGRGLHLKMFPVSFLMEENWFMGKINFLVIV